MKFKTPSRGGFARDVNIGDDNALSQFIFSMVARFEPEVILLLDNFLLYAAILYQCGILL